MEESGYKYEETDYCFLIMMYLHFYVRHQNQIYVLKQLVVRYPAPMLFFLLRKCPLICLYFMIAICIQSLFLSRKETGDVSYI